MTATSAIDVLDGAAALLRQGWGRGRLVIEVNGKRCFCLRGALLAAGGGLVLRGTVRSPRANSGPYSQASSTVRALLKERGDVSIPFFNDYVARSVEDVLDVIEAAKARLT